MRKHLEGLEEIDVESNSM